MEILSNSNSNLLQIPPPFSANQIQIKRKIKREKAKLRIKTNDFQEQDYFLKIPNYHNMDEATQKKMKQMIRNRISAQQSRERAKDMIERLKEQNLHYYELNIELQNQLKSLQQTNKRLIEENKQLKSFINKEAQIEQCIMINDNDKDSTIGSPLRSPISSMSFGFLLVLSIIATSCVLMNSPTVIRQQYHHHSYNVQNISLDISPSLQPQVDIMSSSQNLHLTQSPTKNEMIPLIRYQDISEMKETALGRSDCPCPYYIHHPMNLENINKNQMISIIIPQTSPYSQQDRHYETFLELQCNIFNVKEIKTLDNFIQ